MNLIERKYHDIEINNSLKTVPESFDLSKDILVTVNVEVFNHEKYLRQCLESILSQKVSFNVAIHIHDDASTDGSKSIIEEYRLKYPHIIFPIIQNKNIYSVHQKENDVLTIQGLRVKGKYVAMCEGDDYWTNPFKLQTQVSLMEQFPNSHLCLHIVEKINENTKELMTLMPQFKLKNQLMNSKKFIKIILNRYAFQTSSYFFRVKDSIDFYTNLPKFADVMPTGDETMIMYYGQLGDVIFINKKMSVYRKFAEGSWSIRHRQYGEKKNEAISLTRVLSLREYDKFTSLKYHSACEERINRILLPYYIREKKNEEILKNDSLRKFCKKKHFLTYLSIRYPRIYNSLRKNKDD